MKSIEVRFAADAVASYGKLSVWLSAFKTQVAGRIFANLDRDTDDLDRVIEIAEFAPLPGAFVAAAFYQRDLNEALTRMGLYMGAGRGTSAGTLVSNSDSSLRNYVKLVAGHNLPGRVVLDFEAKVSAARDPELKATPHEAAFLKGFVPSVVERGEAFYLIGVSIQSTKPAENVVSHEIFHAYQALRPAYRAVTDAFWRKIPAAKRDLIRAEIARGYNVEDDALVLDEFQAYVMQDNARADRLKNFAGEFRAPLIAALRDAGELPDFVSPEPYS